MKILSFSRYIYRQSDSLLSLLLYFCPVKPKGLLKNSERGP